MKRSALVIVPALLALLGCSESAPPTPEPNGSPSARGSALASPTATDGPTRSLTDSGVLDLVGDWKEASSEDADAWFVATIADALITVSQVSEGGASTVLYWAGSYQPPVGAETPYSWKSINDHSQTDPIDYALHVDTLTFSFDDGLLTFEAPSDDGASRVDLEPVG